MGNIKTIHVQCKHAPQGYFRGPIKYLAKRECFVFALPPWAHASGIDELTSTDISKLESAVHKWAREYEGMGEIKTLVILYDVDNAPPQWDHDHTATIKVSAEVYTEKVLTRPGGEKLYSYDRLSFDDPRALPMEHGRGVRIRYNGRGDKDPYPDRIPYTPEAAAMFRRIFEGIMAIREMLVELTKSPDTLVAGVAKFEGLPGLPAPAAEVPAKAVEYLELDPCPECRWPGGRIEDTDAGIAEAVALHAKHCATCTIHPLDLRP